MPSYLTNMSLTSLFLVVSQGIIEIVIFEKKLDAYVSKTTRVFGFCHSVPEHGVRLHE